MKELYDQFIDEELNDLPNNLTSNDVVKVLKLFQEWLIERGYLDGDEASE
jgi:hypothetical protein